MPRAVLRQTLDRRDARALAADRERRAGFDRLATELNEADAALRGVAADMRSGEEQRVAQENERAASAARHRPTRRGRSPSWRLEPFDDPPEPGLVLRSGW